MRLLYRIVFLGASGGGIVVYSGRPIHLPGPFRIVSLFGPITTGGLWTSLVDALPFAALIIAFGTVFSVVDVRRVIAESSRVPVGRGVLTSIAIGIATYPALVTSARNIRAIQRLRRERGGLSVLPPLFERTIERAHTLGASMAARGFARTTRAPELNCAAPASWTTLVLTFPAEPIMLHGNPITVESLTLQLGDVVLLTGPTGSGKSSLLRALAGLHTHVDAGLLEGAISIGGVDRVTTPVADTASFLSFVPQRVRDSFVAGFVRDELQFGLTMQGMTRAEREVRIREVVDLLKCERLLDQRVETLSSGEAVLVAIGAALATRPTVLLLDEPFADLDAHQSQFVASTLATLATRLRMCLVIAEHREQFLASIATRRLEIGAGHSDDIAAVGSATAAQASVLSAERGRATPRVQLPHPITALTGPNGSGKTTRLFAMAQECGERAALIPESLSDFFCRPSVRSEADRSDKTAGALPGTTFAQFCRLSHTSANEADVIASRHPRDLSHGQQMALALSIGLAGQPDVLLIDEPTRGLDARCRDELITVLRETSHYSRITMATHDASFVTALGAVDGSLCASTSLVGVA